MNLSKIRILEDENCRTWWKSSFAFLGYGVGGLVVVVDGDEERCDAREPRSICVRGRAGAHWTWRSTATTTTAISQSAVQSFCRLRAGGWLDEWAGMAGWTEKFRQHIRFEFSRLCGCELFFVSVGWHTERKPVRIFTKYCVTNTSDVKVWQVFCIEVGIEDVGHIKS